MWDMFCRRPGAIRDGSNGDDEAAIPDLANDEWRSREYQTQHLLDVHPPGDRGSPAVAHDGFREQKLDPISFCNRLQAFGQRLRRKGNGADGTFRSRDRAIRRDQRDDPQIDATPHIPLQSWKLRRHLLHVRPFSML